MHITGKSMEYLYICKRKLWLFSYGVRPEMEFDNVKIGMLIGESTFKRNEKDKEVPIGDIGVIDRIELKHGRIHETKKGKAPRNAEEAQTRYYLWWLRDHGVKVDTCVIHYPKQKNIHEVVWDDESESLVMADLTETQRIISLKYPPEFEQLSYCKSCAYEMYCKCNKENE